MSSRSSRVLAGLVVGPLLVAGAMATPASAAPTTLDVATTGKDTNAGTPSAPLKTVQAAINKAKPGTTIRIHKGTYNQQLIIRKSGTATAPITVTTAGDGPVMITSDQPAESCDSRQPSPRRTILMQAGSDYWTFQGLSIHNGIYINGGGGHEVYTWHDDLVDDRNWQPRRAVPGASKNDPVAAKPRSTDGLMAWG